MTTDEKDQLVTDLLKMLQSLDPSDPAMASIKYFRGLNDFVEKCINLGKKEGFTEGYKEARRKLEKEQGKLN